MTYGYFFRYNNKEIMRDMTSGSLVFPVVTIPKEEAFQLFIAPQHGRCTEFILQDSREVPAKVISKPYDAGSVKHDAGNAENVKSQISKTDDVVILSKSSIVDKPAAKEPIRSGTSSPKHNQPKWQNQTAEAS